MRILPALTNVIRYSFSGHGGKLFFDKKTDPAKGTEVTGLIRSSFTAESLGFQLSLADVIGLQGYFNRADTGFETGPDDYIELVSGRRFVFSLSWRNTDCPGITVVMTDMEREMGKRLIAMIELSDVETRNLREMVKGLPSYAERPECVAS